MSNATKGERIWKGELEFWALRNHNIALGWSQGNDKNKAVGTANERRNMSGTVLLPDFGLDTSPSKKLFSRLLYIYFLHPSRLSSNITIQNLTYYVIYSVVYKTPPLIRKWPKKARILFYLKTTISLKFKTMLEVLAVFNNL